MTRIIATNILSPLGTTTEENFRQVLQMHSLLRLQSVKFQSVEPFYASMFNVVKCFDGYTRFELLCIKSAKDAIAKAEIDATSKDTVFVLSSTKGNIELLETGEDTSLLLSAKKIAGYFGNPNQPVIVSNACVSGVCAIITAQRLLESGTYKKAVVVGCDVITRFVVAGFQSFKALSPIECKPFDADRQGLNLGEAAATMILEQRTHQPIFADKSNAILLGGCVHNDANHISGPSRTGEGSYRCLRDMQDLLADNGFEKPDFICLHGTATRYNDDMESVAIQRTGYADIPVFSLKGYYGHTMGAAGILETILSVEAMNNDLMLATRGLSNAGTTEQLKLSKKHFPLKSSCFIKLLSGFGGTNAAIAICKPLQK